MTDALLVALGALVGAPLRHLVDTALGGVRGVLVVNLSGCLAAGAVAGLAPPGPVVALLLTGLLGAFTTASALAAQVVERRDRPAAAAGLLSAHLLGGTALAGLGLVAGRAL